MLFISARYTLTTPSSFYITNDHMFTSKAGILRSLEERLGPFSGATEVQYCDASGTVSPLQNTPVALLSANPSAKSTTCRRVSDSFPGANGLLKWKDELWVGDCRTAQARGYRIGADKSLQLFKTVVCVHTRCYSPFAHSLTSHKRILEVRQTISTLIRRQVTSLLQVRLRNVFRSQSS